ncbi:hypothetical protein SDC9_113642 [bioreactor metagenome]|uniref:Uncharacterized protein n=1 Tax=bioreactor metagenome TaxID=1076179 RepID=A0A645BQ80_9ZZZZ
MERRVTRCRLVDVSPVIRLPRALTVPHREQQTGSGPVPQRKEQSNGNCKSQYALQKVRRNGCNARVEHGGVRLFIPVFLRLAQRHCNKAKPKAVIGQGFHRHLAENGIARNLFICHICKENQESTQHSAGNQRLPQRLNQPAQHIRHQHAYEQNGQFDHQRPRAGIPEVMSCCHYRIPFVIDGSPRFSRHNMRRKVDCIHGIMSRRRWQTNSDCPRRMQT